MRAQKLISLRYSLTSAVSCNKELFPKGIVLQILHFPKTMILDIINLVGPARRYYRVVNKTPPIIKPEIKHLENFGK